MNIEDEDFFKSEVVKEELDDLQECYTELLQMSQGFQSFDNEARLNHINKTCLLYTSPSPRDGLLSRMPSSA